jgi:uncharacterized protein YpuA (DUF1002 family)
MRKSLFAYNTDITMNIFARRGYAMRHSSIDWIKISEALDHAYEFLVQQSAEDEHLKQIEAAKKMWKQAFAYRISSSLKA